MLEHTTTSNIWNMLPCVASQTEERTWVVVPINQVGVMGSGMALQAKNLFPEQCADDMSFRRHIKRHNENLCLGMRRVVPCVRLLHPLVFFPTKEHWSRLASLPLIHRSLLQLKRELVWELDTTSKPQRVLIPQIGCGLGRLDWEKQVRPVTEEVLKDLPTGVTAVLVSLE